MRHIETVFSGFGGQGVLFAGQLLSYAGIADGLYVTWIPSYGPEMRGGTANCTVILSEEEIGAPVVRHPTAVIAMNSPSWVKYRSLVKRDGFLFINSSLIKLKADEEDARIIAISASDIATDLGNVRMANMVMLGAFVAHTGIVTLDAVKQQLAEHLSERQRKWLEPNYAALDRGAELV
jgi:2-oxoglutarate ferredoxin oxidoreductase subunit gamma